MSTQVQVTTEPSQALRDAMVEYGWKKPVEAFTWGRRVEGGPGGVRLERDGKTFYVDGPFAAVRAGDQMAIVRRG